MPKRSGGDANHDSHVDDEFYYTVLNLPKSASPQEIRDRYKHLSLIFHPDKQHDPYKKETATVKYLEIQKAYEVLSDAVTREAYDLLGPLGLELLSSSKDSQHDSLREELLKRKAEADFLELEKAARPRGSLSVGFDISPIFSSDEVFQGESLVERLSQCRRTEQTVQASIQTPLRSGTTLQLIARQAEAPNATRTSGFVCNGTLRHQYSTNLELKAVASVFQWSQPIRLQAAFVDQDNGVVVKSRISPLFTLYFLGSLPALYRERIPIGTMLSLVPIDITLSRRLFPTSNTKAAINLATMGISGTLPIISFNLGSSRPFDWSPEASVEGEDGSTNSKFRIPSQSGLELGAYFWTFGVKLIGLVPALVAEGGITFAEVGIRLTSAFDVSLWGLGCTVGALWESKRNGAGAEVELRNNGVTLRVNFIYAHQHLQVPIKLSHEYDPELALWTALLPSTAFVLGYHFLIKPVRRKRRLEYFRQARRELRDAKADLVRQSQDAISLLQATATRSAQAEASSDGLLIQDASYGPTERGEDAKSLDINVTVALQALISMGQLYIPGRRSKAGLQGFYDPVPGASKTLRVRYTFRQRPHYAEIPDFLPVVLPLEDHLVE